MLQRMLARFRRPSTPTTKRPKVNFNRLRLNFDTLEDRTVPTAGAVFTTNFDGSIVNQNIYDLKTDVYFLGGPDHPNSQHLPGGDYYFQVTDPSGMTLLSSDAISEREVHISDGSHVPTADGANDLPAGFIDNYLGTTHVTNNDGVTGAVTVRLMPYDDTPNAGGEYKAWLVPVADYHPDDNTRAFGFVDDSSKTDNFKVRQTDPVDITISGYKFYDYNSNGSFDGNANGEGKIPSWTINLYKDNPTAGIQGIYDPADVWVATQDTDAAGNYSFDNLSAGTYIVCESTTPPTTVDPVTGLSFSQTGWFPTTNPCATVPVSDAAATGQANFGNVELGHQSIGGLTLGFWSNQNGQQIMNGSGVKTKSATDTAQMTATLSFLSTLNLRNANGTNFDPTSYSQFRTWLLSANATNMAYMLSAQLAAMELNVRFNFVPASTLVYAPGAIGANQYDGLISINDLMADANSALGANGLTVSASPDRTYQELLKNALDAGNNNTILTVLAWHDNNHNGVVDPGEIY